MVALECASCGYENTLEVLICMQSKLLDPNKAFACAYNLCIRQTQNASTSHPWQQSVQLQLDIRAQYWLLSNTLCHR